MEKLAKTESQPELIFGCVKVGERYGADYVNKLFNMVRKNLTIPHRFVCITDDDDGFDSRIEARAPAVTRWGWWNLMEFWAVPSWANGLPIAYVGLDTIIRDNIDFILKDKLTMIEDFSSLIDGANSIFKGTFADGVCCVPPEGYRWMWDRFLVEIDRRNAFPMHVWLTYVLAEKGITPDFYQKTDPGKVVSYKWPEVKTEEPEAAIICFHGEPRPAQAALETPWINKYWNTEGL